MIAPFYGRLSLWDLLISLSDAHARDTGHVDPADVAALLARAKDGERAGVLRFYPGPAIGLVMPAPGKTWEDVWAWLAPHLRARQAELALVPDVRLHRMSRALAIRRPATNAELILGAALMRVTLQQGDAGARRFVQAFRAKTADGITERQAAYLRHLVTKYRRQILPDSVTPEERHLLAPYGPVEAFRALDWPAFVMLGFAHSSGEPNCGSLLVLLNALARNDVDGVRALRRRILDGHRCGVLTLLGGERLGKVCPGPGKVWGDVDDWIYPWWRARRAEQALAAAPA